MSVELYIFTSKGIIEPDVVSGIKWETRRVGEPSSLTFTCLQEDGVWITEGNSIQFIVDKKKVFFGFVFTIDRDKSNEVEITAYDQLRYLKNKTSYLYKNKTVGQLVKMISNDFGLKTGTLTNTRYAIPKKVEDNATLFDIIQNALDETLQNTGKLYVLYDDFGALTLKNAEKMILNLIIDEDTGQNFKYSSSINGDTYNRIVLLYEKDGEKRKYFVERDEKNIMEWGVLQYFEKIDTKKGAKKRAKALLQLYDCKEKNLTITDAFGDVSVRAGTSVGVRMNLVDTSVANFMFVEKAVHTFAYDSHFMDLTLRGGDFSA